MAEIIKHNGTIVGQIQNTDITESTSTSTGSVILDGGLAIKKNIYLGDSIIITNKGTVTQLTSITTPVTLNKPLGVITTVGLTLSNNTNATFTVNNTYALSDSVVLVSLIGYAGSGNLNCECTSRSAGSFNITIMNSGGGTLDALAQISFMLF